VPILREGELDIYSHSPQQTGRLGARLGKLLQADDIICLSGDMGAGKTVFSAGIGKGWQSKHPLTSPTYNLVHQHTRTADNARLYHLDCYRLSDQPDLDSIGWDDIIDSGGVVIVEWAEYIEEWLPAEHLWIELRTIEDSRRNFIFEAIGKRYETLVKEFRAATFGL